MKRIMVFVAVALCWSLGMNAQYFGEPFYKAGFDSQAEMDEWTVETTLEPTEGSKMFYWDETTTFGDFDSSSTASLSFKIEEYDSCASTITSPVISLSGKKGIIFGFSHKGLTSLTVAKKLNVYMEIKIEGESTWNTLYASPASGTKLDSDWEYWYCYLDSGYDGKDVRVRVRVDGTNYGSGMGWGNTFSIDGIFFSQRNAYDAKITSLTPNGIAEIIQDEREVSVSFTNNGLNDITSLDVYYQIDDEEAVKETCTLSDPLVTNATASYTFVKKADFTSKMRAYTLKAWVDLANDQDTSNDLATGTVENILGTVPYAPAFGYMNGRIWNTTKDCWTAVKHEESNTAWSQSKARNEDFARWTLKAASAKADCNTYLISRPMWFEDGKEYDLRFLMYSEATDEAKMGKVAVYLTQDATASTGLVEIWRNESVGLTNCLESEARIVPTGTGIYYVVFVSTSPMGAAQLWLYNISMTEAVAYDVKNLGIESPQEGRFQYTGTETVSVRLLNNGTKSTEPFDIYLSVDGQDAVKETITQTIPKGEEYLYTFAAKADLSDASRSHTLEVWTSWEKDALPDNDKKSVTLKSEVVAPPYTADFATDDDGTPLEEASYWKRVDTNSDGITFEPVRTSQWNTYFCFEYAGSEGTTDEYLYSRPIALQSGKIYRVSSRINVERPESEETTYSYSLKISLYKLTDGTEREWVCDLNDMVISDWVTYESIARISADDVYVVGYHFTSEAAANYYVRFSDFSIIETAENDIAISSVLLPGTQYSGYRSVPVGVNVLNNGIEPISKFTVKVSSPSLGTKEETFELEEAIGSQMSKTVYFADEFVFGHTGDEDVTFEAVLEDDKVASNNTRTVTFSHLDNLDVPVSLPFQNNNGWLNIDGNRDGRMWAYSSWYGYYIYMSVEGESDWLVSRSMNLKAGQTYKVSFKYRADDYYNSLLKFKAYALNCGTKERTEIAAVSSVAGASHYSDYPVYTGYLEIPSDGVYSIVFEDQKDISNSYNTVEFYDALVVEEVSGKPDLELVAFTEPTEDRIFTDSENVTVSFRNSGELPLNSVSFACAVKDTVYHICYQEELAAGAEAEVTFAGVDLNEPGDYELSVSADLGVDLTMENNVLVKTFKSLPIVEVQVVSLNSPKSGSLTKEEPVIVTLQNNGKGGVSQVPIHYSVKYGETDTEMKADEVVYASIPQGASYQYTFETRADMSAEGTYVITVYTDAEGETDIHNDTITVNVSCTHKDMDTGVVGIKSPANGLMTHEESVTVVVKNYGEDVVYDIPVSATIEKEGEAVAGLSGEVPVVLPGESVEYTFAQTVDMYMAGDYTITASTNLEKDVNPGNDTAVAIVHADKVDCGVEEILSPEAGCEEGEYAITVTVRNFGDVEVSNVPIYYKTGTMPQAGLVEETIPAGGTLTYTFPNTYRFREGREYTLTVYTDLEGDMAPENDACEKVITPVAPSRIGGEEVTASVYPNPARETVTLTVTDGILKSVRIFDITGKVVGLYNGLSTGRYTIPVSGYQPGVYYARMETAGGTGIVRFVVE